MLTSIFNDLHNAIQFPQSQCDDCRALGWPVGMFDCRGDNVDCIDFRI